MKLSILLFVILYFSCNQNRLVILTNDPNLSRKGNLYYYGDALFTGDIVNASDVKLNEKLIEVEDGLMHGSYKEWNPEHVLITEKNYYRGKEQGVQKGYHYNGGLSYEYKAKAGDKYGVYKEYYPNGNLQIQNEISKGEIIKSKILDIDGSVLVNYVIKNGRYYGPMGSSTCVTVFDNKLTNEISRN